MNLKAATLKRVAVALVAALAMVAVLDLAFPPPIERGASQSVMVSDRRGKPLRAFPTAAGRWRFAAELEAIDPLFIESLVSIEDKRFYRHGGIDGAAMVRAMLTSLRAGRIVSGGSTITMQTARLLEPRPRNVGSKLAEMVRALQIERRLSKDEILELYLTLAPYGGNLEGVRAASLAWFGHEPDRLSDGEIALLIALPQSPEMRRPDRRPDAARTARAQIAAKLEAAGSIGPGRRAEILGAPLPQRSAFPARAWHATAQAREGAPGNVRSTLDAGLQADLEALLARKAAASGPGVQFSAIVVDIPGRAVRASVGSASRGIAGGWLDLTRQPRSPGSTLKPFIYAMAFDDGTAAPGTLIADLPRRFSSYQPENFDRGFSGDVTVAQALQHSLNVPAVMALDRVGPERFAAQLALAGASPRISGARQEAGLALALGGAGLTLQELAVLYAALGDGGTAKPLVWRADEEAAAATAPGHRLIGADSAARILAILKDGPTPEGYVPGRLTRDGPQIAFKTGTSYGYRDAWAAGVSGGHAIVVWAGRADGAPRPGHVGRSDALPVLFEIADRAAVRLASPASREGLVSLSRTEAPGAALARFADGNAPPEILFPPRDAELWAGLVGGQPSRPFVFAGQGTGPLDWFVDGEPCPSDAAGLPVWQPSAPGFYMVSAVDADGRESRVRVRVLG